MKFQRNSILFAFCLFLLAPAVAIAQDATAIMKAALDGKEEAKSTIAFMDMTLRSANGSEQPRQLKMEQLGSDKQLMWFISPTDLMGTAFLQIKDDKGNEKKWLYLPAFKRTNRISGKRKRDSFMGSEFTYEDMSDRDMEDYKFTYIKKDQLRGKTVHVINGEHLDKDSGYSKTIFYVEDEHKEILKADMYSRSGDLEKIMNNHEIEVIDGRRIPVRITMESKVDGDSTEIKMREIKLDQPIPDNHFTQRYMPKVR